MSVDTMLVSQSDWRRFHECPRQYRLSAGQPRSAGDTLERQTRSLLGDVVDDTIAAVYEHNLLATSDELVDRLQFFATMSMAKRYPASALHDSPEALLQQLRPIWPTVLETVRAERLFAAKTFVRRDFTLHFTQTDLKGQPDLVFYEEDPHDLAVVDVKLRAKSSLTTAQLKVYCLAVAATFKKPITRAGYWLPRDAAVHWIKVPSAKTLAKFAAEMDADLTRLVEGDSDARPASHCGYCEVRERCPEGVAYIQNRIGSTIQITGQAYTGKIETVGF